MNLRALTHIYLKLLRDMYLQLFRDMHLKLLSDMYLKSETCTLSSLSLYANYLMSLA